MKAPRSARHRTGLRNRHRSGRSTYSRQGKGKRAEIYDRPYLDHPNHPGGIRYGCCTKRASDQAA